MNVEKAILKGDKKNIVIKVKYPAAGKAEEIPAGKTITVWNVKRIMLAVFVLILMLGSAVYFFAGDDGLQEDSLRSESIAPPETVVNDSHNSALQVGAPVDANSAQTAVPGKPKAMSNVNGALVKPKSAINKKTPVSGKDDKRAASKAAPSEFSKNVSRALLTRGINGKEPMQAMAGTISASKESPVAVYYYSELKDMRGKKVFHEWLQDGKFVAKYALPISADRWRTYSHRILAGNARGHWLVRMTDENGRVLNEKTFTAR